MGQLPGSPPAAGSPGTGGAEVPADAVAEMPSITAGEPVLLATVDGAPVTSRDVDLELIVQTAIRQQLGMPLDSDPAEIERFRGDILERLLDQRALVEAARAAGIALLDDEVSAGIDTMASQLGVDGTVLHQAALDAGITDEEYRTWVEGQLMIQRYLGTDEARAYAEQALAERGIPASAAVGMPIDQEALASVVSESAEIYFVVDGEKVAPAAVGEIAPDVTVWGLDGEPIALSDLRGKPVVLNFWATWCVPCRMEMPILQQAHDEYGDEVMILGVDVDEPVADVEAYLQELGIDFPIAIDRKAAAARLFRSRALPMTFFIDADGVVQERHRGALRSPDQLAALVDKIRLQDPETAP